MRRSRILIVDDEPGMLEVCADTLRRLPDTEIVTENNSLRVAELVESDSFDIMITDIRMPGCTGIELLRVVRRYDPQLPVLMLTAFPSVETAVESMKQGAADYLTKPFLPDDLVAATRRLLEERRLRQENRLLQRQLERDYSLDEIVGKSPSMQSIFQTILQVADSDVDVLIVGETGTGKELVARSLHKHSRRKSRRFVPVDCAAIPENLLESELFGHERGAFTGAHQQSLGLLEFADGGTFLLDEIAELPVALQAKLLRALQERKFRRVGGTTEIPVDVRVVAATNRDLAVEMRERRFREDLFYRIHVACISLPPLRERGEDIPLLVHYFVNRFANEMNKGKVDVDPEVIDVLCRYAWPGNVRQLQNVVKRSLAMLRSSTLKIEDLPDEIVTRAGDRWLVARGGFFDQRRAHVVAFERDYLQNLMRANEGDAARAAREAGIPRGTLYRLLNKYDLDPESFRH
jgi:DNA-binding NtrC family response regulator